VAQFCSVCRRSEQSNNNHGKTAGFKGFKAPRKIRKASLEEKKDDEAKAAEIARESAAARAKNSYDDNCALDHSLKWIGTTNPSMLRLPAITTIMNPA
jgi:hypothetical protein